MDFVEADSIEFAFYEDKPSLAEFTLMHYGMPRRSGRYPYGSGKDPYQHACDFLGRVEQKRKEGFTYTDEKGKTWTGDTAIAKSMGLSTTEFRTELGLANDVHSFNNTFPKNVLRDLQTILPWQRWKLRLRQDLA